jgi:hypothetical protein
MTSNRHLRNLIGLVLGGCAGLSLTVSILPLALYLGGFGSQLALTQAMAPLWPWVVLIWAAGGLSMGRVGAPWHVTCNLPRGHAYFPYLVILAYQVSGRL